MIDFLNEIVNLQDERNKLKNEKHILNKKLLAEKESRLDIERRSLTVFLGALIVILILTFSLIAVKKDQTKKVLELTEKIKLLENKPVEVLRIIEPPKTIYTDRHNYIDLDIPQGIDTSFKTYMDYRTIKDKTSRQWALQQLAKTDNNGFRRFNDQFLIAVGTFYAKEVGKELRIEFDSGAVIYAIVGDVKQDRHTDKNNQFVEINGNMIEFIVDTDTLPTGVKVLGDVSPLGLHGNITKIQEVKNYETLFR